MKIQSDIFWRIVVCGFIATFVMTMISFLQSGIGLPAIDVGHIMKSSFNQVHAGEPYSILWGNVANFIVGILLALIYVVFVQSRMPGNWAIQGLLYGLIISFIAGLIVAPLASSAAGESFGFFYLDTWFPGLVMLAGILMHVGYGLTLSLSLRTAGVDGVHS
jgi:uncharacterized membrane protein YagU involved in acid resistance